jgi:2-polyprenyl-3-methyl-5-hydroxy-6-metoxy-1,4-benzoquinol methylase
LPAASHGQFLSGYTSSRVFFTYHRCAACAGLFCPVYYTQEQLNRLYSQQHENMCEVPLAAREATQLAYLRILRPHIRYRGGYLELGPDIGLFAEACARTQYFSKFFLFEPNVQVHQELRNRLSGYAVSRSADSYAPAGRGSHVSLAVAIHVLDHLLNPAAVLQALFRDLQPGGLLFLVTHNEASTLARALGRRWPPFTLQHPQVFSPASLCRLLARCGFEVVEWQTTTNYFPLSYLVRAGLTIVGGSSSHSRVATGPLLRLRLGNFATLARKPWGGSRG